MAVSTWTYGIHFKKRIAIVDWDVKPPLGTRKLVTPLLLTTERERAAFELGQRIFSQMDNPK